MTDIPVSLCTHVVYDRLAIDLYSKVTPYFTLTNPDADEPLDEFEKFSALKRTNPQLKLIICLRSIFIAQVASEPDQRRALIESLIQFMSTYNLDGVELFWADERFKSEESLYQLLEEVKSGFRAAGHPTWEVTILIDIDHRGLDHARLCAGERNPKYHNKNTKPSANTLINIDGKTNFTLDGALQYWIDKGCPAQKIVLGVAFIAQVFKLEKPIFRPNFYVKDLRTFCTLTEDRPFCSYIELCRSFNEGDWTMGWDDTAGLAPHAFSSSWWIAYENEASVGRKGEIAREKGLAGVYAVTLDMDDYRGKCGTVYPLMNSLSGSFSKKAKN
ncbi:endochitinase-like [Anopheles merus]|uniref:endochitinase-like n=1 Tax=Anopheles merus TaxID=30066 RepID=UPI001BE44BFA|nr:endochitinase-like [Anopheles merus]